MTNPADEDRQPPLRMQAPPVVRVLAIDPGRDKCGVAVVVADVVGEINVLERRIVPRAQIGEMLPALLQHNVQRIVLGHATTSVTLKAELLRRAPDVDIVTVDETGSTLEARELYWQEHRPRGWRRLVPLSLQVPPEPVDDFAAVVLARRFFNSSSTAPQ